MACTEKCTQGCTNCGKPANTCKRCVRRTESGDACVVCGQLALGCDDCNKQGVGGHRCAFCDCYCCSDCGGFCSVCEEHYCGCWMQYRYSACGHHLACGKCASHCDYPKKASNQEEYRKVFGVFSDNCNSVKGRAMFSY